MEQSHPSAVQHQTTNLYDVHPTKIFGKGQYVTELCQSIFPLHTIGSRASPDDGHCGCHRRRRDHSWDVLDGDESAWDAKKHTREACTNAYGYVPKSGAHYLRCDIETDLDKLCQFVLKVWKIQQPRLIMCIIGGAKYFKLNERLEREFIKGIIQAALKAGEERHFFANRFDRFLFFIPDGWIFSSGFKTGVVKLVGEAIHDHRVTNPRSHITAIGFPKWGATKTRDALRLVDRLRSSTIVSSRDGILSEEALGKEIDR